MHDSYRFPDLVTGSRQTGTGAAGQSESNEPKQISKKKGQEMKQDALYAGGKRARELERKRERLIRTQPKRE